MSMSEEPRMTPPAESGRSDEDGSDGTFGSPGALERLLPPPAFTPGGRRQISSRRSQESSVESLVADLGLPEDALFVPDAPIQRKESDFPADAFISPDEPLRPRTSPRDLASPPSGTAQRSAVEVEITGIGESDSSYFKRSTPLVDHRLEIDDAARVMEDVARFLREDGPASLLKEEGRSGFESMLRGFVAGYYIGGTE